jgi:hypothetical protein
MSIMHEIELPIYSIVISVGDEDPERPGCYLGGSIISQLHSECPYCSRVTCYADCDGGGGDIDGLESEEDMEERRHYNAMADAVESLILAHVMAGIDVTEPAYSEGVETAMEAIANKVT